LYNTDNTGFVGWYTDTNGQVIINYYLQTMIEHARIKLFKNSRYRQKNSYFRTN